MTLGLLTSSHSTWFPKFSSLQDQLSFTTCLPGVTKTRNSPCSKPHLVDQNLVEPRCGMGALQPQPGLKQLKGTWRMSLSPVLPRGPWQASGVLDVVFIIVLGLLLFVDTCVSFPSMPVLLTYCFSTKFRGKPNSGRRYY